MSETKKLLSDHPILGLLTKVVPIHTWRPLRAEMHLLRVRLLHGRSARRRLRGVRGAMVNIGCGSLGKTGWVNLDGWAAPGVTCLCDCRMGIPLPSGSARGIYSEHFLEHLHYEQEVPRFLRECHRVLEDGGVARFVVPDTLDCMRGYFDPSWEQRERLRGFVFKTPMERVNDHFRQDWQHRFAWDFQTLAMQLKEAGFADVRQQEFGVSVFPELCLDSETRRVGSLYADARK